MACRCARSASSIRLIADSAKPEGSNDVASLGCLPSFSLVTGTWAYKAGLGKFLTKASFGQWTFEIWEQRKALKAALVGAESKGSGFGKMVGVRVHL